MLNISLISGLLPVIASLVGLVALGRLVIDPSPAWWRVTLPLCVGLAALATLAADLAVDAWRPFPDPLPARIVVWVGVSLLALALVVARLVPPASRSKPRYRLVALPALVLVVLLSMVKINAFYGYRPTLGSLIEPPTTSEPSFAALSRPRPILGTNPNLPLIRSWRRPVGIPGGGSVTSADIPGTRSGFAARRAAIYLPPAYFADPRPLLPVLMLIAGQPGGPDDWVTAGSLPTIMNTFADTHAGLAPIVIVPDATGSTLANPMCLDSRLGHMETYLAVDLPRWVEAHLQIDRDTRHWAIGGFSYGGTCSLQLALRHPALYPTFLDISGQQEPTLGTRTQTVLAAFGGDAAKFQAVNPLDILTHHTFPATLALLAVGADDAEYRPQAQHIAAATTRAAITTRLLVLPGAHSWIVAAAALRADLPRIAERDDLLPPS
jgi:S-formylglutathione hydrolase FrmB